MGRSDCGVSFIFGPDVVTSFVHSTTWNSYAGRIRWWKMATSSSQRGSSSRSSVLQSTVASLTMLEP